LMEKYLAAAESITAAVWEDDSARRRIVTCEPESPRTSKVEACAKEILRQFVGRAWRRPASSAEISRLVKLVRFAMERGADFDAGIRLAVQATISSPHFLFRVELDESPDDPGAVRRLNDFELASRLSYFLWSSMPDDELFAQARKNTLRKNLDAQVRRILADPKSQALVDNFAGQWFQLRNLEMTSPNKNLFPQFSPELRRAMQEETLRFFSYVMRENRSVLELVDADYTFLNEPLARFYGIHGVEGNEFRQVSLTNSPRGGVIAQASVLTLTSNPTRTSPVKRGKWIMENILGTPPPEPPAGVPMLDNQTQLTGSLRERMEQHRADPNCAVCHRTMDQLGFAFENFDAVGAWRTRDGDYPECGR